MKDDANHKTLEREINAFGKLFSDPMRGNYQLKHDSPPEQLWLRRRFKLRSKRLRKKFMKDPERYLSRKAGFELGTQRIAFHNAEFIKEKMSETSFARKLLMPGEIWVYGEPEILGKLQPRQDIPVGKDPSITV